MGDIITLIQTIGVMGIWAIIFAESGLLIGFFLPGDSLLFTAGYLASQGHLPIFALLVGTFLAATLGDNLGYFIGKKISETSTEGAHGDMGDHDKNSGKALRRRFRLSPKHIARAQKFYKTYGGGAIVVGRFMPVARTLIPVLAGIARMNYAKFVTYNVAGALIWAVGMPLLGFYLGSAVPSIDHYIWPIVISILLTSLIPGIFHFVKRHRARLEKKLDEAKIRTANGNI